jgi:hypothetical protein
VLPPDIWIAPASKWRQSFEGAIERTSEKAQSLLPKSPFDETLLGLTIFLLSFPRARTPSKCEGDRKAFGYPGNLRYESIAAGVRPLREGPALSAGHRSFRANSQIDTFRQRMEQLRPRGLLLNKLGGA